MTPSQHLRALAADLPEEHRDGWRLICWIALALLDGPAPIERATAQRVALILARPLAATLSPEARTRLWACFSYALAATETTDSAAALLAHLAPAVDGALARQSAEGIEIDWSPSQFGGSRRPW